MNQLLRRVMICFFFLGATQAIFAQKENAAVLGQWKGESLCTVKPSACHDEVVVYEITATAEKKGTLIWKADKIVNGEQQNMGTLDCTYDPGSKMMTCDMP